jgi:primase-polymerase (primpol)-like protein
MTLEDETTTTWDVTSQKSADLIQIEAEARNHAEDRQYTYNVTLRRVRVITVAVE